MKELSIDNLMTDLKSADNIEKFIDMCFYLNELGYISDMDNIDLYWTSQEIKRSEKND